VTGRGKSMAAVAAVAVALGATGIGLTLAQQQAGEEEQKGQVMTYEIGVTETGTFVPLATLSFDSTNTGTLVLGAPHPRTPALVKLWTDLAGRDRVRIDKSVSSLSSSGDETVALMSVEVAKSDPKFPEAILRYMAHDHGFDSRP
jgi:hypothetical protein